MRGTIPPRGTSRGCPSPWAQRAGGSSRETPKLRRRGASPLFLLVEVHDVADRLFEVGRLEVRDHGAELRAVREVAAHVRGPRIRHPDGLALPPHDVRDDPEQIADRDL